MEELLITGWKDIAQVLGVSVKTAKKWVDRYKIPITYLGVRPVTSLSLINCWLLNLHEIGKKKERFDSPTKNRIENIKKKLELP